MYKLAVQKTDKTSGLHNRTAGRVSAVLVMFLSKHSAKTTLTFSVRARFFAPVKNDPEVHPTSCTTSTGPFPGVKRPKGGADNPSLLASRLHSLASVPA